MSDLTYDGGYWLRARFHRFEIGYDVSRPWVRPNRRLPVGFIRTATLNSQSMTGRWIETAWHWSKHGNDPLRRFSRRS